MSPPRVAAASRPDPDAAAHGAASRTRRATPGPVMLRDGAPVARAIAMAAADWVTLLMSGESTEADRTRWQAWRAAHPDHERAWQHVEAVTGRLQRLEGPAAYRTLSAHGPVATAERAARRRMLSWLMWGGAASGAGWLTLRTAPVQRLAADHRTGTGEQRQWILDDGTRVLLNTASAIDIDFGPHERLLRLVAGEVCIETAAAAGETRPLIVQTAQGRVRPLGTRFIVRCDAEALTSVAVLAQAVEIMPAQGAPMTLRAGQRASFSRAGVQDTAAVGDADAAWVRGQIVADHLRLDAFVAELSRYRTGLIRCAPEVAHLRVSGVYPLNDIDQIFVALARVLPVRVRQRTRFWVTLDARA